MTEREIPQERYLGWLIKVVMVWWVSLKKAMAINRKSRLGFERVCFNR